MEVESSPTAAGRRRVAALVIEYDGLKVELLPCPFCGSDPMVHSYRNRMRQWYRVKCRNDTEHCSMIPETSAYQNLEDAAADWNQRPNLEEPVPSWAAHLQARFLREE